MQNRQLQTGLTEGERSKIETDRHEQLELREELKDKPSEPKLYEEKLNEAAFHYNREEGSFYWHSVLSASHHWLY